MKVLPKFAGVSRFSSPGWYVASRLHTARFILCVFLLLGLAFMPSVGVLAHFRPVVRMQQDEPTPAQLIDAVNALRASNGLPALKQNAILMQTAQSQANALLGSGGAVGHSRPGGMTYTDQLLLLGYPLAGDLSLGGIRSENFVFGNDLTIQDAIGFWLGDEPHTNTMLASKYIEIGAGVAVESYGTIYYVVDTARPTSSGQPQQSAMLALTTTAVSPSQLLSQYIIPVSRATARADGTVLHRVQYGQTLWSIAIAYGTTINSIRALNNLGDDPTVYEGQVLVVQRGATQPAPPSATASGPPTLTPTASLDSEGDHHVELVAVVSPSITAPPAEGAPGGPSLGMGLGILLFAIVMGCGTAAWLVRKQK
jgi:uncharacterized protein YkwD